MTEHEEIIKQPEVMVPVVVTIEASEEGEPQVALVGPFLDFVEAYEWGVLYGEKSVEHA